MKTVTKNGLTVSKMCLGCMHMGTRLSQEQSFAMLDHYFEAGGRFLDTSNNYAFWMEGASGGESEEMLNRWLIARGCRDKLVIATKVGAQPTVPGTGFETAEGLSRDAIIQGVEASMQRLGVDHIELYYAHVEDVETPQDETLRAFEDLKASGKVGVIGCSNHSAKALNNPTYQVLQQRLTYLSVAKNVKIWPQKGFDREVFEASSEKLVVAYAALGAGAYAGAKLPPMYDISDNHRRLRVVARQAKRLQITPSQVVLSWLMAHGVVPLIASSQKGRLKENLAALDVSLDAVAIIELGPLA